jgi:hypothetical protein
LAGLQTCGLLIRPAKTSHTAGTLCDISIFFIISNLKTPSLNMIKSLTIIDFAVNKNNVQMRRIMDKNINIDDLNKLNISDIFKLFPTKYL